MSDNYIGLQSFEVKRNFWEENPQYLSVKECEDIYKKDKTKNKSKSSNLMWGICLYLHPKSIYSDVSLSKRGEIIEEDFLKNQELLPKTKNKALVEKCKILFLSRNERVSKSWGDKLDERFELLDSIQMTLENMEDIDKAMARTEKLWKTYQLCLKDLADEAALGETKGGVEESLSEKGLI